ncbi:MAG: DUF6106 family protein [Blautia sp.]|nr:DUF6106 family protein [Blautia sp.]
MSDLYSELLVKKEKTMKDNLIKVGAIGFTALLVLAGLFIHPLALLPAIILGVVSYLFIIPKTDLEYEYLFVNGEMDIDMIMAKSKRKKAGSFRLSETDIVAPMDSHRLDYYKNNQKLKVLDFSSGNEKNKRYGVVTRNEKESCMIIIEPDENMAKAIKNSAPSKVFLD